MNPIHQNTPGSPITWCLREADGLRLAASSDMVDCEKCLDRMSEAYEEGDYDLDICADCDESLSDPEYHCPDCGAHMDGDGTCTECEFTL